MFHLSLPMPFMIVVIQLNCFIEHSFHHRLLALKNILTCYKIKSNIFRYYKINLSAQQQLKSLMKRTHFSLLSLSCPTLLLASNSSRNDVGFAFYGILLLFIFILIAYIKHHNKDEQKHSTPPNIIYTYTTPDTTPTATINTAPTKPTTPTPPTTNTAPTTPTTSISLPSSFFCENWQLLAFASEFGPTMQVGICHNSNGSPFHVIRFIKPNGAITYAYFFSQLGVLSPSEISRRRHSLWVGRTENNRYYLYARSENGKMWNWECKFNII